MAPPDQLLLASRQEILDLMRTVIDKSQQKLSLQLLEVCHGDRVDLSIVYLIHAKHVATVTCQCMHMSLC